MRLWRAHRAAVLLLFIGLLGVTTLAWGQFANQTGNVVGTVGGACNSGLNDYAWPDTNGNILKCVSSVWTLVTQPATAAGSTGYVQFNNAGALAGSANLFWDNTNNRLGIGTTAPLAMLQIGTGAASSGQILVPSGSAAAPAVAVGTSGTGLYSVGSTELALSVGGAVKMDYGITSAGAWTTDGVPLQINTNSAGALTLSNNQGGISFHQGQILTDPSGVELQLGNVDAASPVAQTLQVQNVAAGTSNTAGLNFTINGSRGTGTGAGGSILFQTAPLGSSGTTQNALAPVMTIASTGNVGIGTAVPGYAADISNASGTSQLHFSGLAADSGGYLTSVQANNFFLSAGAAFTGGSGWIAKSTGAVLIGGGASGTNGLFNIYTNAGLTSGSIFTPTERFRITSSGTVGIGTSTVSSSNLLEVNGAESIGYPDIYGGSAGGLIVAGNVGIGTNAPAYLLHVGSAAASGIVEELQNSSGNCTFQPSSSALQVICSSDRRLKEDIDDAVPALPQLADMRVRNYTIIASGERTIGVIAQEMIWKHPDLVHMGPDGYYGVEAPNVWLLVKAIQELNAANDDLTARLSADDDALKSATDSIAGLRESFEAYKSAHP
jgi:hypothetical protein